MQIFQHWTFNGDLQLLSDPAPDPTLSKIWVFGLSAIINLFAVGRQAHESRRRVGWALAHLQSLRTPLLFEDPRQHTAGPAEVGFSVGDITRIDKSAVRGAVVEAPDLLWRA